MSNPFYKERKLLYLYLSLFIIPAGAHFSLLFFASGFPLPDAIKDSLVSNLLLMIIGINLWYSTTNIAFEKSNTVTAIINHLAAALIFSVLWVGSSLLILNLLAQNDHKYLMSEYFWRAFAGIFYYALLTAVNYVIIYYQKSREKEIAEIELSKMVREAELRSLKYQINPHFIFNCLNSISSLTLNEPDKARDMTIKLAEFFRLTLSVNKNAFITLAEELKSIRLYLSIEKVRFGDKFIYTENLSEDCGKLKIPSMILQPLFENAIKYGVYESLTSVGIKFSCRRLSGYSELIISNDYDPVAVTKKGEGIGLNNVKSRLKLSYYNDNLLKIEKSVNEYKVKILIPHEIKI
ncbi:MAG: histidine kinase [Ignavibacteriales bacterium]|nr:histidine kinase [Ignavibacteriales bacterium]MCF8314802.1 histidine kinase [Ignavibacteriales bacterium]MCF8436249.1 histidine kinase [Ignavibacteriales bacterium]